MPARIGYRVEDGNKFRYCKNVKAIYEPRLQKIGKIVVNVGLGRASSLPSFPIKFCHPLLKN